MRSKLQQHLITGMLIQRCVRRLDDLLGVLVRYFVYRKSGIQHNKIFFQTFDNAYSCNLKYICNEILHQKLPWDLVWVRDETVPAASFPPEVRTVLRGSYEYFQEMASAKIWLDNALNGVWFGMPKKKGQVYINTWHGSMGIKRLSGNRLWRFRAKRCKKVTDYCISNSEFEEMVYRDTFWPTTPFLRYGHARNDILLQKEKHPEIMGKVKSYFGLAMSRKIALYAPTFRDDGSIDCFDLDFAKLKEALESKFGGDWVILVRMHFKNKDVKLSNDWNEWLKDASAYPDMQELMIAADFGITDYSSWAYDYVLTRKPLLLYAPDIEKYDSTRGFYYSLYTTPFPVCRNNDEVDTVVSGFCMDTYRDACEKFLEEKGCGETGRAAELTVEKIKEIIIYEDCSPPPPGTVTETAKSICSNSCFPW